MDNKQKLVLNKLYAAKKKIRIIQKESYLLFRNCFSVEKNLRITQKIQKKIYGKNLIKITKKLFCTADSSIFDNFSLF